MTAFGNEAELQKQIATLRRKDGDLDRILRKKEGDRTSDEKNKVVSKGLMWLMSRRAVPGLDTLDPSENMFGTLVAEMSEVAAQNDEALMQGLQLAFDTGELDADVAEVLAERMARISRADPAQLLDPGISRKDLIAARKARHDMLAEASGKSGLYEIADQLNVAPQAIEKFISGQFGVLSEMEEDRGRILGSLGAEADEISKFYTNNLMSERKTVRGFMRRTFDRMLAAPVEAIGVSTFLENQRYNKRVKKRLETYHQLEAAKAKEAAERKERVEAERARRAKGLEKAIFLAERNKKSLRQSDYDAATWEKIQETSIRSSDDLESYLNANREARQAIDSLIREGVTGYRSFSAERLEEISQSVNRDSAGKTVGKFDIREVSSVIDRIRGEGSKRADAIVDYATMFLSGLDPKKIDLDVADLFDDSKTYEGADLSGYGKYVQDYMQDEYARYLEKAFGGFSSEEQEQLSLFFGKDFDKGKTLGSQLSNEQKKAYSNLSETAARDESGKAIIARERYRVNKTEYEKLLGQHGGREGYLRHLDTLEETQKEAARSQLDSLESQIKGYEGSDLDAELKRADARLRGDLNQIFRSKNSIEQIRASLKDGAKDLADILRAHAEGGAMPDGNKGLLIEGENEKIKELAGVLGLGSDELEAIAEIQGGRLEEMQISFHAFFRNTSERVKKFRRHIEAEHKWVAAISKPLFQAFNSVSATLAKVGRVSGRAVQSVRSASDRIPGVQQFRKASSLHRSARSQSLVGLVQDSGIGGLDALEIRLEERLQELIPSITPDRQNDLFQALLMGDPMAAIPEVFKEELSKLSKKNRKYRIMDLEAHFAKAFGQAVQIGEKESAALFKKDPKGQMKFNVKPIRSFASFFVEQVTKDSWVAIKKFSMELPGLKELKLASEEMKKAWDDTKALKTQKRLLAVATKSFGIGMRFIVRTAISPITSFVRFADTISGGRFSAMMKGVGADILRGLGRPILDGLAKRVYKFHKTIGWRAEGLKRLFPKTMMAIESKLLTQSKDVYNYLSGQVSDIDKYGSWTGKFLSTLWRGAKFVKLPQLFGSAARGVKTATTVATSAIAATGFGAGTIVSEGKALASRIETGLTNFNFALMDWGEQTRQAIEDFLNAVRSFSPRQFLNAVRNFSPRQLLADVRGRLWEAADSAFWSAMDFGGKIVDFVTQTKRVLGDDRFRKSHWAKNLGAEPSESEIRARAQGIYYRKLAKGNLPPGTTMDSDAIWAEAIAELRRDAGEIIAKEFFSLPPLIRKILQVRNIFEGATSAVTRAGQKLRNTIVTGVSAGVAGVVAGIKFAIVDPVGAMNAAIASAGRGASRMTNAAIVGIPKLLERIRNNDLPSFMESLDLQGKALALLQKIRSKQQGNKGPGVLSRVRSLLKKVQLPTAQQVLQNDISTEIGDRIRGIFESIQGAIASFSDKVKEKIAASKFGAFINAISGAFKGIVSFFSRSFSAVRDWSKGSQQREMPPGKQGAITGVAGMAAGALKKFGSKGIAPAREEPYYIKQLKPGRDAPAGNIGRAEVWPISKEEFSVDPYRMYDSPPGWGYQTKPDDVERKTVPLFERIRHAAEAMARKAAVRMAHDLTQAANEAGGKWGRFAQNVGVRFWGLTKDAWKAGQKILSGIADNSPGPSKEAPKKWDNAAGEISGSMDEIADSAADAGSKIESGLTQPIQELQQTDAKAGKQARKSGFFTTLFGTASAGVGTMRMLGGGLMGTAAAMGGLSSIFENTNPEVARMMEKFSQLSMVLGAVGAFANGPILAFLALGAATFGLYKAFEVNLFGIREKTAALASFVGSTFNLVKNIVVGGLRFIEGLLGVFGVRIPFFDALINFIDNIGVHFQGAISWIVGAWQGFVDKFWGLLYPIVKPAIDVGNMLIRALNCNPTERIPKAWEGAMGRISDSFGWLLSSAEAVSKAISGVFGKSAEEAEKKSGGGGFFSGLTKLFSFKEKAEKKSGGGFFSGLMKFFSFKKEPPILPVMLDYTKELASAIAMAQKAGDEVSASALGALEGKMSVVDYAAALQGDGGRYLGRAVGANSRTEGMGAHAIAALTGQGADALIEDLRYSDIGLFAQKVGRQLATMRDDASDALKDVQLEFQDRFDYLERFGTTRLAVLFKPGTEILRGQVKLLGESFGYFGKEAFQAIATLDFDRLSAAAQAFGEDAWYAIGRVIEGFKQMSISAIALGIYTLSGLSPVTLAMLGIGAAAFVVMTNFLGIRTILGGLIRAFIGLGKIGVSVFVAIAESAKALKRIAFGIRKALSGDFSEIKAGWQDLKSAIVKGAKGIWGGLKQSLGGAGNVLKGVFQGIRQILWPIEASLRGILGVATLLIPPFKMVGSAIKKIHGTLSLTREEGRMLGESLAESLISSIKTASTAIGKGMRKVRSGIIALGVEALNVLGRIKATLASADFWAKLDPRPAIARLLSAFDPIPAILTDVSRRVMAGDWAAIFDLRKIFLPAIDAIRSEFSKLGDKIKALIPDLEKIKGAIVGWFQPLQGALGIAEGFGSRIWTEVAPHVDALQGKLSELAETLPAAIARGISELPALRERLIAQFRAMGSSAIDAIEQGFSSASSGAVGLTSGLASAVLGGIAEIPQITQKAIAHFEEFGNRAVAALKAQFSRMPEAVDTAMEAMKASLSPRIVEIVDLLQSIGSRAIAALRPKLEELPRIFQDAIPIVKEKLSGIAEAISARFKAIDMDAIASFADRVSRILDILKPALAGALSSGLERVLPMSLQSSLADGYEILQRSAREMKAKVVQIAEVSIAGFRSAFDIGAALTSAISAGITEIAPAIDRISSQFLGLGDNTVERIVNAWKRLAERFLPILSPVVDFATKIAQQLIATLNCNPTERIPEAWKAAIEKISALFGGLVKSAMETAGRLTSALSIETRRIPALDGATVLARQVSEFSTALKAELFGELAPLMERFGSFLTEVSGKMEGMFGGAISQMGAKILGASDALRSLVERFQSVPPNAAGAAEAGRRVGKAIATAVIAASELIQKTKEIGQKALPYIQRFGAGAVEASGAFGKLALAVITATPDLVTNLFKIVGAISDIVIHVGRFTVDFASGAAKIGASAIEITAEFGKFGAVVVTSAGETAQAFMRAIDAIAQLKSDGIAAFGAVKGGILELTSATLAFVAEGTTAFGKFLGEAKSVAAGVGGAFREALVGLFEGKNIGAVFSGLRLGLGQEFDRMKSSFTEFSGALEAGFSRVDGAMSELRSGLARVRELWDNFGSEIGAFGSIASESFGKAIVAGIEFGDKAGAPLREILSNVMNISSSFKEMASGVADAMVRGVGAVGEFAKAIFRVSAAIASLIGDIGKLATEAIAAFEKLSSLGSGVVDKLKSRSIEDINKTKNLFSPLFGKGKKGHTEAVAAEVEATTKEIQANIDKTAEHVSGAMRGVVGVAEATGEKTVGALTEASPGPTWQIRKNWDKTSAFVHKAMMSGVGDSQKAGDAISGNFREAFTSTTIAAKHSQREMRAVFSETSDYARKAGDSALLALSRNGIDRAPQGRRTVDEMLKAGRTASQSGKDEPEKDARTLREIPSAAKATNNLMMSLGGAMSNFAPNIAAPMFMMGDFFDLFESFGDAAGEFAKSGLTVGGTLAKISGSIASTFVAFSGFIGAMFTGGLSLGGIFTAIAGAASTMWAAISGPLLPLLVLVGAAVGLFVVFKFNLFGMTDVALDAFKAIRGAFQWLWQALTKLGESIMFVLKPFLQVAAVLAGVAAGFAAASAIASGLGTAIAAIGAVSIPALGGLLAFFAPIVAGIGAIVALAWVLRGVISFVWEILQGVFAVIVSEGARVMGTLFSELSAIGGILMEPFAILGEAFSTLMGMFGYAKKEGNAVVTIVKVLVSAIAIPIKLLADALVFLLKTIGLIARALAAIGSIVAKAIVTPFKVVADVIRFISEWISAVVGKVGEMLGGAAGFVFKLLGFKKETSPDSPAFATGGWVSGNGTSTSDSISARLSRNEFVVNAAAARKYPQLLELINDEEFEAGIALQPIAVPSVPVEYVQSKKEAAPPAVIQPTFNFNFSGDVVLKGANGPEAANEFFESLGPAFNRKVREILRDMVDKMK